MFDSTMPERIPAGARRVALYRNGRFAARVEEWGSHWERVYWIDVNATDPEGCSILDIEAGDVAVQQIPAWVQGRLAAHPGSLCRLYCSLSAWGWAKDITRRDLTPDERTHIRWWIANPTGRKHLVPGSSATQWLWGANFDQSCIHANWDR